MERSIVKIVHSPKLSLVLQFAAEIWARLTPIIYDLCSGLPGLEGWFRAGSKKRQEPLGNLRNHYKIRRFCMEIIGVKSFHISAANCNTEQISGEWTIYTMLFPKISSHPIISLSLFCEREQWSTLSCEQRALNKIQLANSEHIINFPLIFQMLYSSSGGGGRIEGVNNILSAQCECRRFYMIYGILRNQANFKENPSMRATAKILRARASEHSS